MNKKILEAIPPFFGGKRKLLKHIIPEIKGNIIADVFAGGCSVSLAAKMAGKKVIANDIAYRSRIIGDSLIRNNEVRLSRQDVFSLFLPSERIKFVEAHFVPKYFTKDVGIFLDTAFANARKRSLPKKELLMFLLYRFIMHTRQFGQFGHCQDGEMIAEGKTMELLEKSSEARARKVEYMISHPLPLLLKLKDQINAAIFDNGQENEVYQMDCFEFLAKMKSEKRKIGTAYFDSPYCGSLMYSSAYAILDRILEGRLDVELDDDAFNKSDAISNFEKLLAMSDFIPHLILSMGYNPASSKGIKGEELLAVVQKFRPAKLRYLKHKWSINNIVTKTDNKKTGKSQDANVEYLIITD